MILGIDECTDLRNPGTRIVTLRSAAHALRWLAQASQGFAFPGAADADLPLTQQNFHRRVRAAYQMPCGFRWASYRAEIARRVHAARGSIYGHGTTHEQAQLVRRLGVRVENVT